MLVQLILSDLYWLLWQYETKFISQLICLIVVLTFSVWLRLSASKSWIGNWPTLFFIIRRRNTGIDIHWHLQKLAIWALFIGHGRPLIVNPTTRDWNRC